MTNENKAVSATMQGTTADNSTAGAERSEYEKLKAQNDSFEKELIRGREMRAEMQKLEAEKMLAGTAGGRVEPQPHIETAKEYAARVMKNDVRAVKNE
jgi:hypothetical protein